MLVRWGCGPREYVRRVHASHRMPALRYGLRRTGILYAGDTNRADAVTRLSGLLSCVRYGVPCRRAADGPRMSEPLATFWAFWRLILANYTATELQQLRTIEVAGRTMGPLC